MKLTINQCQIAQHEKDWLMVVTIPSNQYHLLDKLKKITDKEEPKTIEVKTKRKGRSLNANAYAWAMMDKLAKFLNSTAEEIYIQMLHDYGVTKYRVCAPKDFEDMKMDYKIVEIKNKVQVINEEGKVKL